MDLQQLKANTFEELYSLQINEYENLSKRITQTYLKKFKRRKVIAHHIWSADLVILPLDRGYKYLFNSN